MMDLNFVEIILQTAGEFSEKFEARDLKLISNLPIVSGYHSCRWKTYVARACEYL